MLFDSPVTGDPIVTHTIYENLKKKKWNINEKY